MGIPFNNLICASNENNILTDFFHTGSYDMGRRHLHQTVSPSIDILKSSNLERLLYHVTGGSGHVVAGLMRSLEENKHFKVRYCKLTYTKTEAAFFDGAHKRAHNLMRIFSIHSCPYSPARADLEPVSRKPRKLFGPVKPFLDHLYLKIVKCIRLKLLV